MSESKSDVDLNLFDPEVQACPWDAYKVMRDRGPVYQDPNTGFFIVTRYKELREMVLDLSLIHISEPTRLRLKSRIPSSA